jgi:hypothetical protein
MPAASFSSACPQGRPQLVSTAPSGSGPGRTGLQFEGLGCRAAFRFAKSETQAGYVSMRSARTFSSRVFFLLDAQEGLPAIRSVTVPAAGPGYTSRRFKVPKSDLVSARLFQNLAAQSSCFASAFRFPGCALWFGDCLRNPLSYSRIFGTGSTESRCRLLGGSDSARGVRSRRLFRCRTFCSLDGVCPFRFHCAFACVDGRPPRGRTTAVDHDAWVDNLVWVGPPASSRRTAANRDELTAESRNQHITRGVQFSDY